VINVQKQKSLFPNNIGKDSIIDNIISAGKQRKTVTITYTDGTGKTSTRETEPYEIKGDKYYGYCLSKGSIRMFTLGNISRVIVNEKPFNPRWEVKF
jgi:predicted DNA-binding transcriptional regulator YafY